MTAFKSKYLQDACVNILRGVAPTLPTAHISIALITTAPTDRSGTSMVEVTGGSYARQSIPFANLPAPTTSGSGLTAIEETSNSAQLSYTSMPACTVVGAAAYDDAATPNFLYYADLTGGSQVVASGATFNLPASNVIFEEL